MTTITRQEMKRGRFNDPDDELMLSTIRSTSKKLRHLRDYEEQEELKRRSSCDWSSTNRNKLKRTSEKKDEEEEKFDCHVYLKLFRSTLKCSIDVIIKSNTNLIQDIDEQNSILIAKTRISKLIKPGVVRVRLVSTLFVADVDVHEDPSLIKLETIRNQPNSNHFDKQFALILKNDRLGPGTIGKLFVESLDPSNGSYTNNSPIFELNLNLASEHQILLTSSHQKIDDNCCPLPCGCVLSSDISRLTITDKCNLRLNDTKLIHRLADPIRCFWKAIGRELFPCFSEIDLMDIRQTYLLNDGNRECTFQLLKEWFIREPLQANIRFLLTKFKLPLHVIINIHNDIVKTFST